MVTTGSERLRPSLYSLEQVKEHEATEDLWMVIYNKVYDITSFAQDHPGGVEVLLDCGGVDATEAFEDVGHSDNALRMLVPYYVGDIKADECKSYPNSRNRSRSNDIEKKSPKLKKKKKKGKKSSILFIEQLTITLLIILALSSLVLYVGLQKIKWAYNLHLDIHI